MNSSSLALTNTMQTFAEVLQAFAFLIGLWLSGYALFTWYQQNKVGGQKSGGSPVAMFLTGNALMLSTVLYTYFMNTALKDNWDSTVKFGAIDQVALRSIEGAQSPMMQFLPDNTVALITGFIYLMGLFSYLKGIYLLRHLGSSEGGQQQSGLSKASAHIIGGMILMNINSFACVILGIFITTGMC